MIDLSNVSKRFGEILAVHDISLTIGDGSFFGLLGTNGAGKSTLLRLLSGILKPDSGSIRIDGEAVYDNRRVKEKLFCLSDDQYFFPEATCRRMGIFYRRMYRDFDMDRYLELLEHFRLEPDQRIRRFSKGMKRQAGILAALCCKPRYLFCDEIFDGLDPMVRLEMKGLLERERKLGKMTILIASHNLKELEDSCDRIGILHRGGLLLSEEIHELQTDVHRVQCIFEEDEQDYLSHRLTLLDYRKEGFTVTVVARGGEKEILEAVRSRNPARCQVLPLTIEEIFANEMERVGYDGRELIF